jgi:hypothetical protein
MHQVRGALLNSLVITEALQPEYVWFAAKPRQLALRIISMSLLRGGHRFGAVDFTLQKL